MWVLVAGSRELNVEFDYFRQIVTECEQEYSFDTLHIVSGGCPNSPDELARSWLLNARNNGDHEVGYTVLPARWSRHKSRNHKNPAGVIRNEQMVKLVKAMCNRGGFLIAFWDGASRGTKTTIDFAKSAKMMGRVYQLDAEGWYYNNLWEM